MKAAVGLVLALAVASSARADWKDLKPGMDAHAAVQCVGTPILETQGRVASSIWTYDSGGFVLFEGGKVTYWEPSKQAKAAQPHIFVAPTAQVKVPVKPKPTNVLAKS